jgi:hydrogenase/urease accessory protein HupE
MAAAVLCAANLLADEIRPGYLELKELPAASGQVGDENWSVTWKVPFKGGMKLKIDPVFPSGCEAITPVTAREGMGSLIQRWTMRCAGGLTDREISIAGIEVTITDVLVRLERQDAGAQMIRLGPMEPAFTVSAGSTRPEIALLYTTLGFEHILLGFDHLLFVLALLIIVNNTRKLVLAVTAFTISHSITLAGATMGFLKVPQQPVEAVIALSILFLATEIIHSRQGRTGVAAQWPWVVAFLFGLLHGFGFAGALAEVGLPEHAIPLALLFFNVGVELGQLTFIAAVLALTWSMKTLLRFPLPEARVFAAFFIGGLSAFWTIERVVGFWS